MVEIDMSAEMEKQNVARELATARATGKLGKEQFIIYWNEQLDKLRLLKYTSNSADYGAINFVTGELAKIVLKNAEKL